MAPEVIQESAYNEKADMWSIGITAIELATGLPPHASEHQLRALFIISESDPPRLEGDFSKSFKSFVDACLRKIPGDRASAENLKGHAFIKKARSSSIRDAMKRRKTQEDVGKLSLGGGGGANNRAGMRNGTNDMGQGAGARSPSLHLSVDSSLASSAIGGVGIGGATVGARPGGNKPNMWEFDSVDGLAADANSTHHRSPSRLLTDIPEDLLHGPSSSSTGLGGMTGMPGASTVPASSSVAFPSSALATETAHADGDSDAALSPIEVDVESITVAPASRAVAIAVAPDSDTITVSTSTIAPPNSSSPNFSPQSSDNPSNDLLSAMRNHDRPLLPPHLPTPPAPPVEENKPSTVLSDLVLPVISDLRADVATAGSSGEESGLLTALGSLEVAFVDAESARPGISATLVESLVKEILATQSRELRTILMRALHHHETKEKQG